MLRPVTGALVVALLATALSTTASANATSGAHTPSAAAVLTELKKGNARFVSGAIRHPRQDAKRIAETAGGQQPLATIISCADSRVPPELIFDMGVGDLFVIRVAGNVSDTDEIGTAEYGTEHLGTPLLVVMGHTSCGAVQAVCTHAEVGGSIPKLVDNIVPAVERAKAATGLEGESLVPAAVIENVWQSIHDLITGSEIITELLTHKRLLVVGAVYNLDSGIVDWLGEHPGQAALLSGSDAANSVKPF